jgi:glycosyltransferase involved in cell wall biosynthesis
MRSADVLHLALSFTHMNIAGREAALRLGVPYIYSPRMCLDPVRMRQRRLSKYAFLVLYERAIIRDAAAIQVLMEAEREHVLRQGARPEQCVLIPNGADVGTDTIFPDGAIFRKHFRIHKNAPLVLVLGRLQRAHALDALIESFASVFASIPAARLVVAGADERARASLERQADRLGIQQAILIVGRIDGNLRLAAFRAADIFALLPASPGMPATVLEAAAAGTALLVSDRCDLPELARYGAGRLVRPEVEALAAALREMLADRPGLKAMGEAARRMVRERFSFSTVVERVEQMYRSVADRRTGTPTTRAA